MYSTACVSRFSVDSERGGEVVLSVVKGDSEIEKIYGMTCFLQRELEGGGMKRVESGGELTEGRVRPIPNKKHVINKTKPEKYYLLKNATTCRKVELVTSGWLRWIQNFMNFRK